MDDFKPDYLSLDDQETNLVAKLTALENERQQVGAEVDAFSELTGLSQQEEAERSALSRQRDRLSARITATDRVLERVRAEKGAASPPEGISA